MSNRFDKMHTIKQAALNAWENATNGETLSPLMVAIGEVIKAISGSERDFSDVARLRQFSQRIAHSENHSNCDALCYGADYEGEWEVANVDLNIWGDFGMWFDRNLEGHTGDVAGILTGDISRALKNKRLWQAFERYQKTGLTKEHCALLQKLLWNVDTGRGDWISIFVQGKRPFGNSAIAYDIYKHAGWPVDWPEDEGMSDAQDERAWNLFDELIFAAPDAAKIAAEHLKQ